MWNDCLHIRSVRAPIPAAQGWQTGSTARSIAKRHGRNTINTNACPMCIKNTDAPGSASVTGTMLPTPTVSGAMPWEGWLRLKKCITSCPFQRAADTPMITSWVCADPATTRFIMRWVTDKKALCRFWYRELYRYWPLPTILGMSRFP